MPIFVSILSIFAFLRVRLSRALPHISPRIFTAILLAAPAALCPAASVRGLVTDASGTAVRGASVNLVRNGQAVATTASLSDGSYQLTTGYEGRFYLVVSVTSYRQLQTPSFYAARTDSVERDLVIEPEWVHESIVVAATGTPTAQSQTSAATSVLGPLDLDQRNDLVGALRLMPGTFVVQTGQMGAQTSLFARGGNPDSSKILLDGVDVGDMGNQFDFGTLSTTAVESAEVYRGPDSNLYGAGAQSAVVSMTTPQGRASSPSFLFHGDAGKFYLSREKLEVSGADKKLDYMGAFSWLQTSNALIMDEYHVETTSANVGWQPNGSTQIRGTLHYGVDATGVPNAWDFYHITDSATKRDQDTFVSASIDNQTTADFHNSFRYGLTRKREQYALWQPSGTLLTYDTSGDQAYFGNQVTITGANGYSATGRAILDSVETYPHRYQLVSNRDQLVYQGDYQFTSHVNALVGFHFEDERGLENPPSYGTQDVAERSNYDYLAAVHGDYKRRFFYALGGSLEHYSLFGTQTSPRAGLSLYVLRSRKGIFSGTRILFNYGDAVREASLTDQFDSLYNFLIANGYPSIAQQLHIGPLAAPAVRTYESGFAQGFFSGRVMLRSSYFHNQYGREIESVGGRLLPSVLPGLTAAQKQQLETALGSYYTDNDPLSVNTEAFRTQGVESTVEWGIGSSIFMRGGYTYLDGVVQRSFDSDNETLIGVNPPTYNGIPIGANSPLVGARPFRRAPNTGFFTATLATRKLSLIFSSAFASRSDDSTYLEDEDKNGSNSLLLPNRNLDHGYAKLDLGGSYSLLKWLAIYAQAENLTGNQQIAPIGYPSLPASFHVGLRIHVGKRSGE